MAFAPRVGKRMRRVARTATSAFRSMNKRTMRGPRTRGSVYQQIKSLQTVVKKLTPELKYHETDVSTTNMTTAGAVFHLSAVGQGDTDETRTGGSINVNKIHIQGIWRQTTAGSVYRVAVVVDREQVADTSPGLTDVFESADPLAAFPAMATLERFRILKLSTIYEGTRTNPGNQSAFFQFTWNGSLKVFYNGTTGADIQKNGIYILFLSDDITNVVDFEGYARIGFTDA